MTVTTQVKLRVLTITRLSKKKVGAENFYFNFVCLNLNWEKWVKYRLRILYPEKYFQCLKDSLFINFILTIDG